MKASRSREEAFASSHRQPAWPVPHLPRSGNKRRGVNTRKTCWKSCIDMGAQKCTPHVLNNSGLVCSKRVWKTDVNVKVLLGTIVT